MIEKAKGLCRYRLAQAEETLKSAMLCFDNGFYKDAVNRSYYAAFYAVKAVLALEEIDFKRHKDVVAYFNKNYVSNERFEKTVGRLLARLQKKREASDYDDFSIVSKEEAKGQIIASETIVQEVKKFIEQM